MLNFVHLLGIFAGTGLFDKYFFYRSITHLKNIDTFFFLTASSSIKVIYTNTLNIGIINKLRAYALQEKGLDTVQANLQLGLPADDRDFSVAIEILKDLGVKEVNLLTNNPDKMKYVEESGIILNSRIPLQIEATDESRDYLKVKKTYFGHLLNSNQENS